MESRGLRDKKIVIADDYRINVELLRSIVEDAGASVLAAFNGKQCVEIVMQQHVDMILMDKNMPVMDGLDASRAIRSLQHGKDVVIVGITGGDDSLDAERCKQAGMNMVCDKAGLNEKKLYEIGEHYFGDHENDTTDDAPAPVRNTATPGMPGDTTVVMDFNRALREFENDRDLLYSLMKEFCRICSAELTRMHDAFAMFDYHSIEIESHGIKGGAANLRAVQLSIAAGDLERACKQHAENGVVASLLDEMTRCFDLFDAFVKKTCLS